MENDSVQDGNQAGEGLVKDLGYIPYSAQRKYLRSERGREAQADAQRRYAQTEQGQAAIRRVEESEARKEYQRAWKRRKRAEKKAERERES